MYILQFNKDGYVDAYREVHGEYGDLLFQMRLHGIRYLEIADLATLPARPLQCRLVDGVVVAETRPEATVAPPTRAEVRLEVDRLFAALRERLRTPSHDIHALKSEIARTDPEMLASEAAERGVSPAELAAEILQRAAETSRRLLALDAERQLVQAEIDTVPEDMLSGLVTYSRVITEHYDMNSPDPIRAAIGAALSQVETATAELRARSQENDQRHDAQIGSLAGEVQDLIRTYKAAHGEFTPRLQQIETNALILDRKLDALIAAMRQAGATVTV
jgi:hypothetical protein